MHDVGARQLCVGGRSARVWTGGDGPALLLLHGGLGGAQMHWGPVFEGLARAHRVVAPDLPGFTGSDSLDDCAWDGLLNWLDAVLDACDVGEVAVVGNSFGAALARVYASARPTRVTRVVLVNGGVVPVLGAGARWLMRQQWLLAPFNALMGALTYSRWGLGMMVHQRTVLNDEFVAQCKAEAPAFIGLMNMLFGAPAPEARIPNQPNTLIWGECDRFSPLKIAHSLQTEMPGASLRTVEDCGHMPQCERPEVFLAALLELLSAAECEDGLEVPPTVP